MKTPDIDISKLAPVDAIRYLSMIDATPIPDWMRVAIKLSYFIKIIHADCVNNDMMSKDDIIGLLEEALTPARQVLQWADNTTKTLEVIALDQLAEL